MQITWNNNQVLGMMQTLLNSFSDPAKPKIALFTDADPIIPGADLGDLTQPAYTGYALSSDCAFGTPHFDDDGNMVAWSVPKEFKPTADGAEYIVRQIGLVNNAGTSLIASYVLPEPLVFQTTDDVYLISFPLILGTGAETEEEILP